MLILQPLPAVGNPPFSVSPVLKLLVIVLSCLQIWIPNLLGFPSSLRAYLLSVGLRNIQGTPLSLFLIHFLHKICSVWGGAFTPAGGRDGSFMCYGFTNNYRSLFFIVRLTEFIHKKSRSLA